MINSSVILTKGQRWVWDNVLLVEVLSVSPGAANNLDNQAKVIKILKEGYRFANLGEVFRMSYSGNSAWVLLEGQDAPIS
jgi:hypothetical protein